MRTVILLRVAPLVLLAGCGLGGPPQDASVEDFCDSYYGVLNLYAEETDISPELWSQAQDAAADLADVGTPEGTPESAREGFEVFLANHENSDTVQEYNAARTDDGARVERLDFGYWQNRACMTGQVDDCFAELPEAMTESRLERCD